jgi:hypothetical protein
MSALAGIPAIALQAARASGATRPVTLKTTSLAAYSTTTMSSTATVASTTAEAVLWEYKLREINGTTVLQGDRRYILFPSELGSVVPVPEAQITDGGATYSIVDVEIVSAGTASALFVCQVRK